MAGNIGVWGWDTANTKWVKILVDAAGHLQVDVVTSALPAGGATAAHQATMITALQLIDDLRNALGSVNTDDLQVDIKDIADGEIKCYGWDTANWQRLLLEGVGLHNLRVKLYDGANGIDSALLEPLGLATNAVRGLYTKSQVVLQYSAVATAPLRAASYAADANFGQETAAVGLYGYNGATWDRLRVESAVAFNLRVRLYDGANGIDSQNVDVGMIAQRGLAVCASMYGRFADNDVRSIKSWLMNTDAQVAAAVGLLTGAALYGYNGATFDRLRTYPTGILKVGRAEVGLLSVRMTAVGQVGAAGARKLYWMLLNPSAGNSVVELTDAAAGGGAVVADHFDTTRDGHMITFDPPMEFTTGLYLETFTNMTSITFGYL